MMFAVNSIPEATVLWSSSTWEQDPFHVIDIDFDPAAGTVVFEFKDLSGDYHGPDPCCVALPFAQGYEIADFIDQSIEIIRARQSALIGSQPHFDSRRWDETPHCGLEIQACAKTETIQFGGWDYPNTAGDDATSPGGVAIPLDEARRIAQAIRTNIELIKMERRLAALETENAALRAAITPSEATKVAYSGEFHVSLTELAEVEGHDEYQMVTREIPIDWRTVKTILVAIRQHAGLEAPLTQA